MILLILLLLIASPVYAGGFEESLAGLAQNINRYIPNGKTIAVVHFTDLKGGESLIGKAISEELSTDLVKSGQGYKVLDRNHIRTLLKEHKLSETGLIAQESVQELGKFIGASVLLTGTVMQFDQMIKVSAQLIDTETASIIWADTTSFYLDEKYRSYFEGKTPASPAFKRLVLKPAECIGDYGIAVSIAGGEISNGTIKVDILQSAEGNEDYFAILNPSEFTYLTDENGYRYPASRVDGIMTMDIPNKQGLFTRIIRNLPLRYTISFKDLNRGPKVLNFTSMYYTPDAVGLLFFNKTVACSGIRVVEGN